MIKAAAGARVIDEPRVMMETLTQFAARGRIIITYYLGKRRARWDEETPSSPETLRAREHHSPGAVATVRSAPFGRCAPPPLFIAAPLVPRSRRRRPYLHRLRDVVGSADSRSCAARLVRAIGCRGRNGTSSVRRRRSNTELGARVRALMPSLDASASSARAQKRR